MDQNASRALIQAGQAVLGIEFGSTRIKAVLVDGQGHTLAVGTHDWENRLENGIWTYSLEDIHEGLQGCYASLKDKCRHSTASPCISWPLRASAP